MRKIATALLAAALLMLAACGRKTETAPSAADAEQTTQQTQTTQTAMPTEPEYAGSYFRTWSEEIGGTVAERNSYIVLQEDHTGYWIAQDVGTLTWDEGHLALTVGAAYEIALTQENGTVNLLLYEFQDDSGAWIPTAYEKIQELPAEIAQMLPKP